MKTPELYKKYHEAKNYTSIGLFRELKKKFPINSVFYPGCYVHITPSMVFSNVTYADSFKSTGQFFEGQEILDYINEHKEYPEPTDIKFYHQDYNQPFEGLTSKFDLVISQYAGFVGQAVKAYLKKGGILVCNNSHGDASMANLDADYQLIAAYRRKTDEKFSISNQNLENYFKPKQGQAPSKAQLIKTMKGITYTKSPSGYIFEKLN